ncbi:DEAD/DEAH box helicase [Myroides sp. LJL115]
MDRNLEIVYKVLRKNINEYLFKNILNDEIAEGIIGYYNKFFPDKEIDYAAVLIDSLQNTILDKRDVQSVILRNLNDSQLNDLIKGYDSSQKLKSIKSFFEANSRKKVKKRIIEVLALDGHFFNYEKKERVSINDEVVSPFTPLDSERIQKKYFLSLHDYQKNVKNQITRFLFDKEHNRFLVHMPTGSGKTKTCTEAIVDFIRVNNSTFEYDKKVVLWFAHSKELCEQAYDSLKETWQLKGDSPINFVKFFDDANITNLETVLEHSFSIVFVGFSKFQAFLKKNDLRATVTKNFIINHTQLVVVDEAHKSLATTYIEMLNRVTQLSTTKLIGLTATPGRGTLDYKGNQILTDFFNGTIIGMTDIKGTTIEQPLKYLQEKKYLAKIDLYPIEVTSKIEKNSSDDIISSVLSTNPERNQFIVDFIVNSYDEDESILVFANSVSHCIILQALLKNVYNIDSDYVTGSTNLEQRELLISNFKNRKSKILINYGVLTTGFDAPKLNALVIARPTKSVVLYSQMVGRALRGERNGGNPHIQKNKILTVKDTLEGYANPSELFNYFNDFW